MGPNIHRYAGRAKRLIAWKTLGSRMAPTVSGLMVSPDLNPSDSRPPCDAGCLPGSMCAPIALMYSSILDKATSSVTGL